MTFSTYADLKTNTASWLARDDLTTVIPDFITLCEAGLSRKLFRARQSETTASLTPDGTGTAALPSDYLATRRLTWTGSPNIDLQYVHPTILRATYPDAPQDLPRLYTIEGSNVIIRPISTVTLQLLYTQKTAAVSASLNWLYTNYPDVYLKGTLVEAYLFLKDFDNAAKWGALYESALAEIKSNTFNNPGNMQIKVYGFTP